MATKTTPTQWLDFQHEPGVASLWDNKPEGVVSTPVHFIVDETGKPLAMVVEEA